MAENVSPNRSQELQPTPISPEHQSEQQKPVELDPSHEIESGLPDPDTLRLAAEAHAISGKEFTTGESETHASDSPALHQELKTNSYNKTLDGVRRHLSAPEQALSKIIHAKGVEPVTNAAAKTIGRSSGILGGAIAALLTSSYLLYSAKHYGYSYNYSTFILFFVGGFLVGLIVELAMRPFVKRQNDT